MKHILPFSLFESKSDDDTLYIFDFDDTIVDSPRFEELAINYLKEGVTVKTLVDRSLKQIGKKKEDVKIEHGRLYVNDPDSKIDVKGNWVRKKTRVYLVAPDKFYYLEESFPNKLTSLAKKYKEVKNKAIVTARIKTVRSLLEKYLDKLGLGQPNQGLFMYPTKDEDTSKVAIWKAKTIVKLIKDTGFTKVEYFDDKSKIVNVVVKAVKEQLPDVDFVGHKVKSPELTYLNESNLSDSLTDIEDMFLDISDNLERLNTEEEFDVRLEEILGVKSYWKRKRYNSEIHGGFYSIENINSKFVRIKICLGSKIKEVKPLLLSFKDQVKNMNFSYYERWWQDRKPLRGGYFSSTEKNEDFSLITIIIEDKSLNEELLLIEDDNKQDFINEIKDIFIDEIVDVFDIEQLPHDLEDDDETPGIFYDFNDYFLNLSESRAFLEILMWVGGDYHDKFERMDESINKFIQRVRGLGYECLSNYDLSGVTVNQYLDYCSDTTNSEPYEIRIYYK